MRLSFNIATNESVFAMAGYFMFRHAGTEADFILLFEDNICRLIYNGRAGQRRIEIPMITVASHPAARFPTTIASWLVVRTPQSLIC